MGIAHIDEILKKQGAAFMEGLFGSRVVVSEALEASAFSVERRGDQLVFFKRDSDRPMSEVDRALVRFYERPISRVSSMSHESFVEMPEDWRFGMEYVPEGGLYLSYIQVRDRAGKIVRTVHDTQTLVHWADVLGVDPPRVYFDGQLSDDQRVSVMDFLHTPEEGRGKGFTSHLLSILGAEIAKNRDTSSVVIRFGGEGEQQYLAKSIDSVTAATAPERQAKDNGVSDIYYLTLIDFMNFVSMRSVTRYKPTGRTFDQRYLSFICRVFNDFVASNGAKYKGVDFQEPEYMRGPDFDLNVSMVSDPLTRDIVSSDETMSRLFKIVLAGFRKVRKRTQGVFTREVARQFNRTVQEIAEHISEGISESLDGLPLFSEFSRVEAEKSIEQEEEEQEDPIAAFADTISEEPPRELEDSDVKDEGTDEDDDEEAPAPQKVNIIVGRFQPFHNGHASMVEELRSANGLPVVLIAVHPGHNKSGMSPLTVATVEEMLGRVRDRSAGAVTATKVVKRGFIEDVLLALRPDYEPVVWAAGPDRLDGYLKQVEYNFKDGNKLGLAKDFQLMRTERMASGTDVRKLIQDDKYHDLKALIPASVLPMYNAMRNEVLGVGVKQPSE